MSYFSDPIEFRALGGPLEGWRPARAIRTPSKFKAAYSDTISLLRTELGHLGARAVHLQVVAEPGQIRRDGQLRADARVDHPGVVLTVETRRHGVLVYETDVFCERWSASERESWKENLRAVALGLQDLRRLGRYGIANRGQQYAGFRAIGTGREMPAAMTEDRARVILGLEPTEPVDGPLLRTIKRDTAKVHHPDVGGDELGFAEITEALAVLERTIRQEIS